MELWTINRFLRKIGLVLTIICGDNHKLIIERASKYDSRIPKVDKNGTR